LLGLIFRIILLKRGILHEKFAILDLLSIMISIGDFIYCAASGTSVIDPSENVHRLLRGIKIIRIIKILYFAKTWFVFEKTILKIFV
jgi:membrane protein DedA with SNARE-associated domain